MEASPPTRPCWMEPSPPTCTSLFLDLVAGKITETFGVNFDTIVRFVCCEVSKDSIREFTWVELPKLGASHKVGVYCYHVSVGVFVSTLVCCSTGCPGTWYTRSCLATSVLILLQNCFYMCSAINPNDLISYMNQCRSRVEPVSSILEARYIYVFMKFLPLSKITIYVLYWLCVRVIRP